MIHTFQPFTEDAVMTNPGAQAMLDLADRLEPQQYATGIAFSYKDFRMVIAALRATSGTSSDYRNVIDEALVVRHLGVANGNARSELNQILSWEVDVALDPRVSERAQALIDQGRGTASEPVTEDTPESVADEIAYFDAHADFFAEAHKDIRAHPAPQGGDAREAVTVVEGCFFESEPLRLDIPDDQRATEDMTLAHTTIEECSMTTAETKIRLGMLLLTEWKKGSSPETIVNAFLAELGSLTAEPSGKVTMNLAEFARWAVENGTWSGDLDGSDVQDKALACGVIVQVPYDPEKHGTQYHGELDPGDPWYVFSDEFYAALQQYPQEIVSE